MAVNADIWRIKMIICATCGPVNDLEIVRSGVLSLIRAADGAADAASDGKEGHER
jgi:hypothetical protein